MSKNYDSVVVSSRVRLARNFSDLPFPCKLGDERAFSLVMKRVYDKIKPLGGFEIFTMEALSYETRNVMFEKHLISKNLIDEPNFSAVILSTNEEIAIMLNEEDHIREQCILNGFRLREAYEQLSKIDDEILSIGKIAFDDALGFLTACPSNLGTAMRASIMLFLPALSMLGKASEVQDVARTLGLTVRGVMGEGSKAEGYMFQISNQVSLGSSEEEIIKRVENVVSKICDIELDARNELLKQNETEIKDICMRAFGVLSSSYRMTSQEFNELIAKVKLGQALGFIKFKNPDLPLSLGKIVQPFTLMEVSKKNLDGEQRDIFRAEYLRKTLDDQVVI
jgi:protein arginine kinase